MPEFKSTRRELIRRLGTAAAGVGAWSWLAGCRTLPGVPPEPPPDFTAAFLTDPHVFGGLSAPTGCAKAVGHALAQPRRPDLILTGGDLAFDIMETGVLEADAQYDLFDTLWTGVSVPVHHALGNHDLLGVSRAGVVPTDDPLFGKGYFRRRFGVERTYHSFDHENWHFVMLDTVGIIDRDYRGWVDPEQLAWLEDDLATSGKPTVVAGHIPLFSNFIEWRMGTEQAIPREVSVVNAHEVARVLERHPVKLVLAGHLHVNETFHYKGIEFANVGAVCGNWWNGPRDGFEEGYALLSFRGNDVAWRYVDYGWEVPGPEPGGTSPG